MVLRNPPLVHLHPPAYTCMYNVNKRQRSHVTAKTVSLWPQQANLEVERPPLGCHSGNPPSCSSPSLGKPAQYGSPAYSCTRSPKPPAHSGHDLPDPVKEPSGGLTAPSQSLEIPPFLRKNTPENSSRAEILPPPPRPPRPQRCGLKVPGPLVVTKYGHRALSPFCHRTLEGFGFSTVNPCASIGC